MPKELPYFKFEPLEWNTGNIQMCSFAAKGVFIELCSLYWSRAGEVPYALALQKLCNGDAKLMQELENNEIYLVNDGHIIIEFLDEQLNQFQETSVKRRDAANKRWKNANAMQMQSKSNAIREDKIREDDNIVIDFECNQKLMMQIVNNQNEHASWIEAFYRKFRLGNKKLGNALEDFNQSLVMNDKKHTKLTEYKRHFTNWMNTQEAKRKIEAYR